MALGLNPNRKSPKIFNPRCFVLIFWGLDFAKADLTPSKAWQMNRLVSIHPKILLTNHPEALTARPLFHEGSSGLPFAYFDPNICIWSAYEGLISPVTYFLLFELCSGAADRKAE